MEAPTTTAAVEVGAGALVADFEAVTNRVPTDVEDLQFMQLKVSIESLRHRIVEEKCFVYSKAFF